MNPKIKRQIENTRTNKQKIKFHPHKVENNNIYEIEEKLIQLPNGSFVPKKMKITHRKDINPHYELNNKSTIWENNLTNASIIKTIS